MDGERMRTQAVVSILLWALLVALGLPASAADSDFDRGVKLYAQKDFKNAATCFDLALQSNPKNTPALYYKALSLQQQGDISSALEVYTTISRDFPGSEAAKLSARVLERMKKMPKPATQPASDPSKLAATKVDSDYYAKFEAANASDADLEKLPEETRIPFTRGNGGHLFVMAFVNNRPIQVMFDTGASTCLFGENHMTAAGITDAALTGSKQSIGGVGGTQAAQAELVDLRVGDVTRRMPVMVVKTLPTPPLLGQTFYNGYAYDIDNQAGIIRLIKKNSKRSSSYTTYDTIDVPFEQVGNNLVVLVKVNGASCPMFFDTGAAGVVFSMGSALSVGLRIPSGARAVMRGGVGGAAPGYEFEVPSIELGGVVKRNLPVCVLLSGGPPIPLLGQPFFHDRRFTIDNDKHLIKFAR